MYPIYEKKNELFLYNFKYVCCRRKLVKFQDLSDSIFKDVFDKTEFSVILAFNFYSLVMQ